MTEGISKERLIELYVENYSEEVTEELLLSECKELDPWLPIDENTPKDRPILLFYPKHKTPSGELKPYQVIMKYNALARIMYEPTHYQELPGDPE